MQQINGNSPADFRQGWAQLSLSLDGLTGLFQAFKNDYGSPKTEIWVL